MLKEEMLQWYSEFSAISMHERLVALAQGHMMVTKYVMAEGIVCQIPDLSKQQYVEFFLKGLNLHQRVCGLLKG